MYNPLALFNEPVLDKLILSGHQWFVRQEYPRGRDPLDKTIKNVFLISYYNDKHQADVHLGIVSGGKNVYMYDVTNEEDKRKLYIAARQPEGYKVYILQTLLEWEPPKQMSYKLQQYTRNQLGWKTQKGGEKIKVGLTSNHGDDFMLVFKYQNMEQSIPLREFEKKHMYV